MFTYEEIILGTDSMYLSPKMVGRCRKPIMEDQSSNSNLSISLARVVPGFEGEHHQHASNLSDEL